MMNITQLGISKFSSISSISIMEDNPIFDNKDLKPFLLLLVPPSILFWSWVSPLTTKLRLKPFVVFRCLRKFCPFFFCTMEIFGKSNTYNFRICVSGVIVICHINDVNVKQTQFFSCQSKLSRLTSTQITIFFEQLH
jgi:hypothetical protein